jgi:hypothetical protein
MSQEPILGHTTKIGIFSNYFGPVVRPNWGRTAESLFLCEQTFRYPTTDNFIFKMLSLFFLKNLCHYFFQFKES